MNKPEEKKKVLLESIDVRVYKVPPSVVGKFFALTKLHFNNEGWRTLQALIELWEQSETVWKVQTDVRLRRLEKIVSAKHKEEAEDDEEVVATFGGKIKHARPK